ncbi:hypothetical protein [Pseudonocardia spirodelae]|uniref:Uncharacterized protein n=1 Tax=Pseudonocardia spirodelae TaxID=3133431 RepID=A0ABU8TCL0_9PSEU
MDGAPHRPRHALREDHPHAAPAGYPPAGAIPAQRRPAGPPPVTAHPPTGGPRVAVPAPRGAAPWWTPAPPRPVEPAAGPSPDGSLPGFPVALLPRRRRPAVVVAGLGSAIAVMLVVFGVVVGAAGAAGRGITDAAAATTAVVDWRSGGGQVHVTAIAGALRGIAAAGTSGGVGALADACRDLRDEVAAARAYPEIPDAVAQASWAAGLTSGADAARHCIAGSELGDAGLLGSASDELTAMSGHLGAVADRLSQLSG